MKAAVYSRYGGPEVLEVKDIPRPAVASRDVLVKVMYASVNRTDDGFLRALYFLPRLFNGLMKPRKTVLGCEFSGIVDAVGADVKAFKPGDRVLGFDDEGWGSHAEYKVIREDKMIAHLPDNVSFESGAATTEGAHYALKNLRSAGVKLGSNIMVYGATGAIGSAAVQLAKHMGARVVAVCSTAHVDIVKLFGPDEIIDYENEPLDAKGNGFDIIFDAVGKLSFGEMKSLLNKEGVYLSTELGSGAQNPFLALVTPLFRGKRVLFPIPFARKEDAEYLVDLVSRRKFRPVIDRTFASLDDIADAYRYVETGQKVGNVLIKVSQEKPASSAQPL